MSEHLQILREMFPNQLVLDIEQIAQCMKVGKGHIYNLVSAKKLPFRLDKGLAKSSVSIVRFAQYLDSQLVPESAQSQAVVTAKRAVGRPRKTKQASFRTRLFQSELRTAITQMEGLAALDEAVQLGDDLTMSDDVDEICAQEFESMKMVHKAQLQSLRMRLLDVKLTLFVRDEKPVLCGGATPGLSSLID